MLAKFLAIRPDRTAKRLGSKLKLIVVIKEVAELAKNYALFIRQMLIKSTLF